MDRQWDEREGERSLWETARRTFRISVATFAGTAVVYAAWILTSWWIHPG